MSSSLTKLSARIVADYFLSQVDEEAGDNLTNLKLQKLVYYAQGFHLAITGQPLFDDEIQAWQHGPVVPDLYRQYRQHDAEPIPRLEDLDLSQYPDPVIAILDEVEQVYGQFSASRLRNMTHTEPPWCSVSINDIISHESLRNHFLTQLADE